MQKIIKKMKPLIKNRQYKQAFTLLEMLVVLVIVAVLMAIIIPNVSGQKARIDEKANENITEIVHTQAQAYHLIEGGSSGLTLETLVNEGYLTQKQADEANERLDPTVISTILSLP